MYLKRLTVTGFKSFADRISLTFDRGITGIVGPNGSGKSNVIDAVRWVMGEQNAKALRGDKATDIIFAGSDRRKALSMAEVAITFDNSEDDGLCPPEYRHEPEITLMRRIYADGEREYLINRKECRLKDMLQFFAVTGLGGRSYSMIQQGQVDRILNAKPEDVREILEEAAGTLIYKQRRVEAEKRLESTRLNLSRVEDILREVEKQQASLETQVEKAQAWKKLSDELRAEELALLGHNFYFFSIKLREIEELLATESVREVDTLAALSQYEARASELQGILDDADPVIQQLTDQLSGVREGLARAESTFTGARERQVEHARRLEVLATEVQEEAGSLQKLELEVDERQQSMVSLEEGFTSKRAEIETLRHQLDTVDESAQVFDNKMQDLTDELQQLRRLIDSAGVRREGFEREIQKISTQQRFLEQRREGMAQEVQELGTRVKDLEEKLGLSKSGLDEEIHAKHSLEAEFAAAYDKMKNLQNSRDGAREKYLEAKGKLTSLKDLTAATTDAAAAYIEMTTKDSSIKELTAGLLAEHVSFKEKAKELPKRLLSQLERYVERVLVEDWDAANALIRSCQKHQVGGLSMVVLAALPGLDEQLVAEWEKTSGAESLKDYLTVGKNIPAVKSLVDRLYLLHTVQLDATDLASIPKGVVVFTAQGVMVRGPGEFIIGASSQAGFLSRKAEISHLEAELKTLEGESARAQAAMDELEFTMTDCRQRIAEIDGNLQGQNKDVVALMGELQGMQQSFQHKKELENDCTRQLQEQEDQLTALRKSIADAEESVKQFEKEMLSVEKELDDLKLEASSSVDQKAELQRMIQEKEVDAAKEEARFQALKESLRHSRTQLDLVQNKLSRRYDEQSHLQEDLGRARHDEVRCQLDIERFALERERLAEEINVHRQRHGHLHEELRAVEHNLKECRDKQAKTQKLMSDRGLEAERVKMGLESARTQAAEKYQIELANFAFEVNEEFNVDKSSKQVHAMRAKLEAMGPVNLIAMEEYEQLTTRRNFIETQQKEILESIQVITTAITEIEVSSKDRFLITFTTINKEFGELFPILFPGGEAHLELSSSEDPLNGGVEIMVRLPGKKQQRMSLFSGGEKALTAIALIFALLKTKPTPFCFLDEVDAPLDEANVGRYNKVLEALSKQFQFIVITHNRRTMEVLDTLYGVTMQEGGVSSVVGVDMKKDLPAHLKKAFKEEGKDAPAAIPAASERVVEGASSR